MATSRPRLLCRQRWGEQMGISTVADLNERITKGNIQQMMLIAEALQEQKIAKIAEQIAERKQVKFVLIAGPSSSGKTTFCNRLSIQLSAHGLTPHPISLDNYYVNRVDTPVYVASPEQLKRLTGYRLHRGALCAMRRWPLPSVAEVCKSARRVAVMENIVDHTNVGALMRSAAALDVDAVLVTPSCGDPLYRRAARVSMGTVFQIPWTRITGFNDDGTENKHYWPFQGIDELKSLGFTTVAMALEDRSISLDELTRRLHAPAEDPTHIDKLALIFGTEGDGLSHHTIARADLTVKIPMSHGVDSLNVAASSAVAFYATR